MRGCTNTQEPVVLSVPEAAGGRAGSQSCACAGNMLQCNVHMRAMELSMQGKAVKARQEAMTEASKDDDEELLKKREEREAAKKKEEKVHLVFPSDLQG